MSVEEYAKRAAAKRVQQNQLVLVARSLSAAHVELGNYASLCDPGAEEDEARQLMSDLSGLYDRIKAVRLRADPNVVRNPLIPKDPA